MAIAQSLTISEEDYSPAMVEIDDSAITVNEDGISSEQLADGSVVIDFDPSAILQDQPEHDSNLAEYIPEQKLKALGTRLAAEYKADKLSRKKWEHQYEEGLKLLGFDAEDRTEPWDGACGVFHPMLSEAIVRFQAQTIQEVYPSQGPVKTKIVGKMTKEVADQAQRVQEYLNYLITEQMDEYRDELEKLLFALPLAGSAFKKVYYDETLGRPASMYVPAEDFVVPYGASSLSTCERATHVMRKSINDIKKLQVSGFYRDIPLSGTAPDESDIEERIQEITGHEGSYEYETRITLLEMMVDLDLPGFEDESGVHLPYVVTVDLSSGDILSVYRNWREDDSLRRKMMHFVHYQYLPGLGFYGLGLVHMIGGLTKSATSLLRQLVDAGTLSNLPGGLKANGMRIKGDDTPIAPGEFRDVDVPGGTIKENIAFLPYKEPSQVLYSLLSDIVEDGRRFASAADVKAADINGEAPVGTTLAVLEREMKVISAVQARIHSAIKKELRILSKLCHDYGPGEYPYAVKGDAVKSEDFDNRIDIIPVSDPNAGTMAQRIMQYQAALQLQASAPQIYDQVALHRKFIDALGIKDSEDIIPSDDEHKPTDPITENMEIIKGGKVKAFAYQDHEAHIQAHLAALENPKIVELLSMAPDAQTKQAAMMAHISEHLAHSYRDRIEKELGVELPNPNESMPEDIEFRLSKLVAPAAAQLTGKDKREAQAKEQMEQAEDPLIKIEQEKLAQKERESMRRNQESMARIQSDLKKHTDKQNLELRKLSSKESIEGAKIGAQIARDNSDDQLESRKIASKEQIEGAKIGREIAQDMMQRPNKPQDR